MGVILGVSAFYHDSAAAVVRDGEIVAAAQEERFSRRKADSGFPRSSVRYCLEAAGIDSVDALDAIAFYDKPLLTFDRLLETYFAFAPRGFGSFLRAVPGWAEDKLLLRKRLVREVEEAVGGKVDPTRLRFDFHHHSHAASASFPRPSSRRPCS
jgi:carbamoyltransferase